MGEIGFGGCAGFVDNLAQPSAAELLCKSQRQLNNMLHSFKAQVGGNTERPFVRTHQSRNVDQNCDYRKQYRHPSIMGQILRTAKVRRSLKHFPNNLPDIVEGTNAIKALMAESTQEA